MWSWQVIAPPVVAIRQELDCQLLVVSFVAEIWIGNVAPGAMPMVLPLSNVTESILIRAQPGVLKRKRHGMPVRNNFRIRCQGNGLKTNRDKLLSIARGFLAGISVTFAKVCMMVGIMPLTLALLTVLQGWADAWFIFDILLGKPLKNSMLVAILVKKL